MQQFHARHWIYALQLAVACLVTWYVSSGLFYRVVDSGTDLIGSMWAVVATVSVLSISSRDVDHGRALTLCSAECHDVGYREPPGTMRKIALEEHFTTPELAKKYVARPTQSDKLFADVERRLADFDELRLETMDHAGIDVMVLSVTTPGVQGEPDAGTAVRLARNANDFLAREVQRRPDRYAGFAHLAMQDAAAAAAELERSVKDLGFKGALINGQTNGHYLDEDQYVPLWERVQELDVPVYLHPGNMADHPAMFAHRPELDGPTWAWTAETAAHALRLVLGGTFTRFPKLRVILGHMGETLPFLLWRFDSRREFDLGEKLAPDALPSTIIKRNIAITTSGVCGAGPLVEAVRALGEDSVMFSVDYPYEDAQIASDFIESAPISEETRAKVCHGKRRTAAAPVGSAGIGAATQSGARSGLQIRQRTFEERRRTCPLPRTRRGSG